jgi:predicted metallopeptidase
MFGFGKKKTEKRVRVVKVKKRASRKKAWIPVDWEIASDIQHHVESLARELDLHWLQLENIYYMRSTTSKARAYARIWGLSKVWQMALQKPPSYVIEVLAQHFDKLPEKEKAKVLLHEITHIPRNFSGSLIPHIHKKGARNFHDKVDTLFAQYLRKLDEV